MVEQKIEPKNVSEKILRTFWANGYLGKKGIDSKQGDGTANAALTVLFIPNFDWKRSKF